MKISVTITFRSLEGPLVADSQGAVPLTLGRVMAVSLCMARCPLDPQRAWALAQEISKATDNIDIKVEEVAAIKAAIMGWNWAPMIIAQAFDVLEG
jgi:hypothetical protein